MITPSQRHVLPLQGRPGHQDQVLTCIVVLVILDINQRKQNTMLIYNLGQVTGLLTIQFLVKDAGLSWEDKDLLPGVYRYSLHCIHSPAQLYFISEHLSPKRSSPSLGNQLLRRKQCIHAKHHRFQVLGLGYSVICINVCRPADRV